MAELKRIFKRKIYSEMLEWKANSNGKTALLIKGARRVGKSTIAREFARHEYESYIEIDFAKASEEVRSLFDDIQDLDFLFFRLQQIYNTSLFSRNSVIIFDEIQFCPKARQSIKYLVEDGRYDYIETGSLITIRKNTHNILIPSEETRITMFPLDYEEFLTAIGDLHTWPLLQYSFEHKKSIPEKQTRTLMRSFRLYTLIGGMPQAIIEYIESNNLTRVDAVKRSIIQLYLDDFEKIDSSGLLSAIFKDIPSQLSRDKLKFEIGNVDSRLRPSGIATLLRKMEESMTVNICYRCSDPNVGLSLKKDMGAYKIYIGDTGLFTTLAFWDTKTSDNIIYSKLLSDKLSVDLGYVFENVVSQMLKASGHSLFYYTFPAREDNKKYYEVDFLLTKGDKLIPIEVKSSGYKTHKSLDEFCKKYSERILHPVLLYTKSIAKEGNLLLMPTYFTPFL